MSNDDKTARKARSEGLRKQISKYKKQDAPDDSDQTSPDPDKPERVKSPRDFINERMRQLDKDKRKV